MLIYNKLVRDKILEIIKAHGETPTSRVLSTDEYIDALIQKANEEQQELAAAQTREEQIEELADLKEVVKALEEQFGGDAVEKVRVKKAKERGAFEKRIFLERTE